MPKAHWNEAPLASSENKPQYDPCPPGRYICKIIDVKPEFKTTGVESWEIQLEVVDGPESKPDPRWKGSWVRDWLTWGNPEDPKKNISSLSRCKLLFKRCGYDVDKLGPEACFPDMLIGKEVIATLNQKTLEPRDGKPGKMVNAVEFAGYEEAPPPNEFVEPVPF